MIYIKALIITAIIIAGSIVFGGILWWITSLFDPNTVIAVGVAVCLVSPVYLVVLDLLKIRSRSKFNELS